MLSQEHTHFLQFCIQWSSIALLYYDYILTFPMEVEYMWGQKFRVSTLLYIFCRYGLVANVIYLFTITKWLIQDCDTGYKISGALSVFGRIAIIIVWSARTWAVFSRSRVILAFFSIVGTACIILDILHVPVLQCQHNSSRPLIGGILSVLMCLLEFSSAGLTSFRSIQALRIGGPWKTQQQGFVYLVFEQGLLYFGAVSVFTIASLVLNITIPGGFLQRLLNALTLPVSGLMTARFLLHLRHWDDKHDAFYMNTSPPGGAAGGRSHGPWHVRTKPLSALRFATANRGTNTMMETFMSVQDQFGDDPVRRAEADVGTRGRQGMDYEREGQCFEMKCEGVRRMTDSLDMIGGTRSPTSDEILQVDRPGTTG